MEAERREKERKKKEERRKKKEERREKRERENDLDIKIMERQQECSRLVMG